MVDVLPRILNALRQDEVAVSVAPIPVAGISLIAAAGLLFLSERLQHRYDYGICIGAAAAGFTLAAGVMAWSDYLRDTHYLTEALSTQYVTGIHTHVSKSLGKLYKVVGKSPEGESLVSGLSSWYDKRDVLVEAANVVSSQGIIERIFRGWDQVVRISNEYRQLGLHLADDATFVEEVFKTETSQSREQILSTLAQGYVALIKGQAGNVPVAVFDSYTELIQISQLNLNGQVTAFDIRNMKDQVTQVIIKERERAESESGSGIGSLVIGALIGYGFGRRNR